MYSGASGGAGTPNTISGSDVTYAGGGGCGGMAVWSLGAGVGGTGGGGAGGNMTSTYATPSWTTTTATSGTANTGGGGGGASYDPGGSPSGPFSGAGGSGIVIIKEPDGTWVAGGVWGYKQIFKQTVEGNWR